MYSHFRLIAHDGTNLAAWRNGSNSGPRVLICNGMGVPPEAWPRLLADGCKYQVAGWNQRGVLGSDRPKDLSRIKINDHVDDAIALLDALGWDDALVVAWSLGVNVAVELAKRAPERMSGLLSIAGVPGGTFDTILAPQGVPRPLRRPLGLGIVRTGRFLGPQLNRVIGAVPRGRPLAELIRYSGIMLPFAQIRDVQPWVEAFFSQDWDWYFTLALALEQHGALDPGFIDVPVTIVAGLLDGLTSHDDVRAFARKIPQAKVHSLPGSHCLPLEYPDRVLDFLDDLAVRVQAHRAAQMLLARWEELPNIERNFDLRESLLDIRTAGGAAATGQNPSPDLERLALKRKPATGVPWWASQAG